MFVSKYIKIIFVISIMVFISANIPCLYAQETTESISEKTEHEHQHEHEHEQGHQHEPEDYDPTGENAEFGRETHHEHDHEHDDCEYFHKAWREPGTIDIMKKYTFIIFALFGIIAICRVISNNVKNDEIEEKSIKS